MRFLAPSLLLLLAATAPAMPNGARLEQRQRAQAEAGDEIIVYRSKEGESLQSIAAKWFVRPEDWRRVQALNKIKDPAQIPAGTAIRMRSTWLKTTPITAELAAFRGNVQVVRGAEARPVMKGMELSEGDIIETGPNGFATLVLPDASQVSLPSSSRIRLARLRQVPMSESIDRRFTLEQGRSEAKVTPMANPASRFLITTPVAVAAVRGTQFRVTYTPSEQKAVTEVTEGKVAVGRFNSIEEVLVRANFGAIATSSGLTKAFGLLPAPAVDTPERVQNEKVVTFRLKPVAGAERYLVEIATDAGFVDRVGSTEVGGTVAVFEGVANGEYFVRAFAIDKLGLIGQPTQSSFERSFAGPVADEGGKSEKAKTELATLGDRDQDEFAWFAGDSGMVSLVDSGAGAGGGAGFGVVVDGSGAGVLDTELSPVVAIEDLALLLGDNGGTRGGGFGGGGFNGGGYSGGGSGGGGGGGWAGGGNNGDPDDKDNGNSGGGNGGDNTDNGNTGGGNGGNGNGGQGGNGGSGSNGGGNGNGGDTGTGGNGGNDGNGGTNNPGTPGGGDDGGVVSPPIPGGGGDNGGGNGTPGGNPDDGSNPGNGGNNNGGNDNGGNPGGGNTGGGNTGGGENGGGGGDDDDDGGVVIIPVDPDPKPPAVPDDGDGNNTPKPPVPGGGGNGGNGNTPVIPEPATWAMMIAGFGLVGVMMRRRRTIAA